MPAPLDVRAVLLAQAIELPSWAFVGSGTRSKVFTRPGVPRDPYEKIADAAQVHAVSGVAPLVYLHIPWDAVEDYPALAEHARGHGHEDRGDQRRRLPGRLASWAR